MITTDKALDMVPYIVDIYEKLDKDLLKDKSGSTTEIGKKALVAILKNVNKFKPEIYGMVSVAMEEPVDKIRDQSVVKTLLAFKAIYNDIFKDPEMMDFFGDAVKSGMQDA